MKTELKKFGVVVAFSAMLVAAAGCSSSSEEAAPGCGPTTCDGCCTPAGTCKTDESASFCGLNGDTCSTCSGAQGCSAGACASLDAGGDTEPADAGPVADDFTYPLAPASLNRKGDETPAREVRTKITTINSGSGIVNISAPKCNVLSVGVMIDDVQVTTFEMASGTATVHWNFMGRKLVSSKVGTHSIKYVALNDLSSTICFDGAGVSGGTVTIVGMP